MSWGDHDPKVLWDRAQEHGQPGTKLRCHAVASVRTHELDLPGDGLTSWRSWAEDR